MTVRKLPAAPEARPCANLTGDLLPKALERWNSGLMAADEDEENTISVFDPIGYDYWTGDGVTAKRINGILKGMGGADVTVNVNSPGGDLFEGLAIYNLLREYKGHVTIKIVGLAASAASIIAMAGDEIQIARSGFLMIHNTWVVAVGNRNDLTDMAASLAPFDNAMADIYAAQTGLEPDALLKLMDAETWLGGSAAVEQGFAHELLASDETKQRSNALSPAQIAARRLDVVLAKSGMPRSERRQLMQDLKNGTRDAAAPGMPGATAEQAQQAAALTALEAALDRLKASTRTGA